MQAVHQQDPPGRFLERRKDARPKKGKGKGKAKDDGLGDTWYPVDYRKAVDKTSQALREREDGDEELLEKKKDCKKIMRARERAVELREANDMTPKGISYLTAHALKEAGLQGNPPNYAALQQQQQMQRKPPPPASKKRKEPVTAANFVKPSWWSRGTPLMTPLMTAFPGAAPGSTPNNPVVSPGYAKAAVDAVAASVNQQQQQAANGYNNIASASNKRMKTNNGAAKQAPVDDEPLPLPTEPIQARQSSLMRFLGNSGIFGGSGGLNRSPSAAAAWWWWWWW